MEFTLGPQTIGSVATREIASDVVLAVLVIVATASASARGRPCHRRLRVAPACSTLAQGLEDGTLLPRDAGIGNLSLPGTCRGGQCLIITAA